MIQPCLIGITGGSASGKTFLLKRLMEAFSESSICLISQDNYYKEKELQPLDENGIPNYDTPLSIDLDRYLKDLLALKQGRSITVREYTYNNPDVSPGVVVCNPAPIIISEGIFLFYHPEIVKLFDLKIFIDAPEYVKIKRRIVRDKDERGYDLEDVLYRYEHHVSPTYRKYIEPLKEEADIIIPNKKHLEKGLEVLKCYIKDKLNG
ncbi:MAG: uridine kinase [Cytophagaceae bacterium]